MEREVRLLPLTLLNMLHLQCLPSFGPWGLAQDKFLCLFCVFEVCGGSTSGSLGFASLQLVEGRAFPFCLHPDALHHSRPVSYGSECRGLTVLPWAVVRLTELTHRRPVFPLFVCRSAPRLLCGGFPTLCRCAAGGAGS